MPEEFDQGWEYYTADPEVVEALCVGKSYTLDDVYAGIENADNRNGIGFQFTSNPNYYGSHIGPERRNGRNYKFQRRECRQCGYSFQPYTNKQRFCDRRCFFAYAANNRKKTPKAKKPKVARIIRPASNCQQCGVLCGNNRNKFCSRGCASKYNNTGKRNKDRNALCPGCQQVYSRVRNTQKFCSHKCCATYYHSERRRNINPWICENCHKVYSCRLKFQRFCSKSCSATFVHKQRRQVRG